MAINVDIRVQDGNVVITVGGEPSSNTSDPAQATILGAKGKKGGDSPLNPDTRSGGGGPGSGTVVIGPIVIDCSSLQASSGNGSAISGMQAGSSPITPDPGSGGGGPGSGMLVIGPIVIGDSASGTEASVPSKAVAIDPEPRLKRVVRKRRGRR